MTQITEYQKRLLEGPLPRWYRQMHITSLYSEIVTGLWQGGTEDDDTVEWSRPEGDKARVSKDMFDAVVTMYADAQPADWYVEELRAGIYDSEEHPLDVDALKEWVAWAYKRWSRGDRVLIRCQAGINRSGLVMALVLVRGGYEPADAIALIRSKRSPLALMNKSFEAFVLVQDPADWME